MKRGQRIVRRVVRLPPERLEQRDEELLGRVRPAVRQPGAALVGGEGGDQIQHRGARAGGQASGLGQRRDGVDGRPVTAAKCVSGGLALAQSQHVGGAPARVARGARLDDEPRAVGQANGGLAQRAVDGPGEAGDVAAPAVALADAPPARVAENFSAGDVAHEPDDTMASSAEEGPLIHEDLAWRSALEIAALVRDKQLSPSS